MKKCTRCETIKSTDNFPKDGRAKDGFSYWCRQCISERQKERPLSRTLGRMKERCYNPNSNRYKRYGARGITVCEEWRESSESFIEWSKENGYKKGLEIDRIDNNGNYTPKNCRWTTKQENCRNTSKSMFWYVYGDRYDSCLDAASTLNVSVSTILMWCKGGISNGKYRRPKKGCYCELKYKESI